MWLLARPLCRRVLVLSAICGSALPAWGEQFGVFNASIDQPRVNVVARLTPGGDPLIYQTGALDADLNYVAVDSISFEAYLDTGASGHLISTDIFSGYTLSGTTYPGLHVNGGTTAPQLETYVASDATIKNVGFYDVGAVGTGGFSVSQPISLSISKFPLVDTQDIAQYTPLAAPIRAQVGPQSPVETVTSDPMADLIKLLGHSSFNLIGMPAMAGQVMVLDNRPLNQFARTYDPLTISESVYMNTYLYPKGTPAKPLTLDTDPGVVSTKYTVKLTNVDLTGYTTSDPAIGPKPDITHNPFIGPSPVPGTTDNGTPKVTLQFSPASGVVNRVTGSFLLDTGAAVSMISLHLAGLLGVEVRTIDSTDMAGNPITLPELWTTGADVHRIDGQFTLAVQGVGGQTTIAGFYLDRLVVATEQGSGTNIDDPNNVDFVQAPVLINDIFVKHPSDSTQDFYLDGVFGMNFLTATMMYDSNDVLSMFGAMAEAPFDWVTFDEQAGILGLEPTTVPEPAGLLTLALAAMVLGRRRRSN